MTPVYTRSFSLPPPDEREVLRYAACRQADEHTLSLLRECIAEADGVIRPKVCWRVAQVSADEDGCSVEHVRFDSRDLAKNLSGCSQVIIMGATLGTELDRLIARHGRLSPARALLMDALGSERTEALCDLFCRSLCESDGISLRPRFSPGYGDLALSAQREIFELLDCQKNIGLYLTQSLLMTPCKSVTAFAGVGREEEHHNKCSLCNNTDCLFRRSV